MNLLTNVLSVFVATQLLFTKSLHACPTGCYCMPRENPTAIDCKHREFTEEMFHLIPTTATQL